MLLSLLDDYLVKNSLCCMCIFKSLTRVLIWSVWLRFFVLYDEATICNQGNIPSCVDKHLLQPSTVPWIWAYWWECPWYILCTFYICSNNYINLLCHCCFLFTFPPLCMTRSKKCSSEEAFGWAWYCCWRCTSWSVHPIGSHSLQGTFWWQMGRAWT